MDKSESARLIKNEKLVERLLKRRPPRTVKYVSPAILNIYKDKPSLDGSIGGFVIPCAGTLLQVAFNFTREEKAGVRFTVCLKSGDSETYKTITANKVCSVGQMEVPISPCDVVTIKVHPEDVENVSEVYLSLLLTVDERSLTIIEEPAEEPIDEGI